MFKNPNLKNKWLWLIFGVFFVFTVWGLIKHQPWRDEAQAWLIVRDLPLSGVIKQMPYEGTPPLWHLVIFPLVKLGLPYNFQLIVHYLFALIAVFVLIFFSPFPKIIKFILPFNYYFIFEYSLVARNYNLSALLLFIIASLFSKRFKKPILYAILIFLLAWTNIHSLALAGLLFAWFVFELIKNKEEGIKSFSAAIIMLIGLASAVIMLIPQIDQSGLQINVNFFALFQSLALALLPLPIGTLPPTIIYLSALAWIPLVIWLLKSRETKILFIVSYLWLAYIFLFKHSGDLRHYGLILIFFIFLFWLDLIKNKSSLFKKQKINESGIYLFFALLLFSAFYGLYFFTHNYGKNFSGAKEMANYLKENNLVKEEIAAYPSYSGSALLPYLPGKEFYQMETFKKGTYLTWNNIFYLGQRQSYPTLKHYLKNYYQENYPNLDSVLLLTVLPEGFDSELELIATSKKATVKIDEFFYLYRLKLK